MAPAELRYTRTHEWARREGDVVTVGITDYAAGQLGDIVYLELPAVGRQVRRDGPLGVIESVKAAVDLYSPVTGEVVETNQPLADSLDQISASPYQAGWMAKIRLADPGELDSLMDAPAYEQFCQGQEH